MRKKCFSVVIALLLILSCAMTVSATETGNTSAVITFLPGTLSLSEMSAISFGSHTITGATNNYPATDSKVFLNVFDYRGTGTGWKVTAIASGFLSDTEASLNGSTITFLGGTATTSQPGNVPEPSVEQNILLDCDGVASEVVATAGLNQGLGSWSIEWNGAAGDNDRVALSIPVPTVGTHTATITWTLTAGP